MERVSLLGLIKMTKANSKYMMEIGLWANNMDLLITPMLKEKRREADGRMVSGSAGLTEMVMISK